MFLLSSNSKFLNGALFLFVLHLQLSYIVLLVLSITMLLSRMLDAVVATSKLLGGITKSVVVMKLVQGLKRGL